MFNCHAIMGLCGFGGHELGIAVAFRYFMLCLILRCEGESHL
ncbi:hypothetical protein [Helicobacter sp. MIT 05-5294]|nr:hypothetical protein [Helicobacter sp. MIT 05-5294]